MSHKTLRPSKGSSTQAEPRFIITTKKADCWKKQGTVPSLNETDLMSILDNFEKEVEDTALKRLKD